MIFLYLLVLVISILIGIMISCKLKKRYKYFKEFIEFLDYYKQNISYLQTSMIELVSGLSEKLTELKETLFSFNAYIKDENAKIFIPSYLNKEEEIFIRNSFERLGVGDYNTELDKTEKARVEAQEYKEKNKHDYEKYGKVVIKISILIGLLIVILLL